MDAIDCALVRCADSAVEVLATHEHPIDAQTRKRITAISQPGTNEIDRMGVLDRELGQLFAAAVSQLLADQNISPDRVRAIGSHGQTIRHRPPSGATGEAANFTLQIGDPNTIAEQTGITTVADFRRRDIAAGGEGAPLAPAFHAATLAREGVNRAIVNIGGIANITVLQGQRLVAGYDTGPGNTLLDHWILRHCGEPFDRDGQWAAAGEILPELLQEMLGHPYFTKSGPRSTGKEAFNLEWLDTLCANQGNPHPRDVQASLLQLTVDSIASAIAACTANIGEVYVCGGGAHNTEMMRGLRSAMTPTRVATTEALGLHPDWVEAAAFAWLASRTLEGLEGNAPVVTGAAGPRILGGIFPGA